MGQAIFCRQRMAEKTATWATLDTWNHLNRLPGGRWLCNWFPRRYNRYSG